MDPVHDRGSMDPVHESGPWTRSKVGVHGPLVHVLSSPESWRGSLYMYLLSFPRFWTLFVERFWFLFWSILNGVTLKTSNWPKPLVLWLLCRCVIVSSTSLINSSFNFPFRAVGIRRWVIITSTWFGAAITLALRGSHPHTVRAGQTLLILALFVLLNLQTNFAEKGSLDDLTHLKTVG